MPALPVQPTAFIGSTGATESTAFPVTASVPEARQWLMLCAALSLELSANWWSRKRLAAVAAASS